MGIYIPNMKIPNYCGECKVKGDGSDAFYTWSCPFTGREYPWHMILDGRLPECPFKEVPETHGDLIDRDALEADILPEWNGVCVPDNAYSEKLIYNAPTIIEAEGR